MTTHPLQCFAEMSSGAYVLPMPLPSLPGRPEALVVVVKIGREVAVGGRWQL